MPKSSRRLITAPLLGLLLLAPSRVANEPSRNQTLKVHSETTNPRPLDWSSCGLSELDTDPAYLQVSAFLKDRSLDNRVVRRQIHPKLLPIALSNLAEGLVGISESHPRCKDLVEENLEYLVRLATQPSSNPYLQPIDQTKKLGMHGLYLSHLNIVLCMYEHVARDRKYFTLNERISTHLAKASLEDPQKHVQSYANQPYKWPADQSATLFSLHLFDQNFGTELSKAPIASWVGYMNTRGIEKKTGLPVSEITGGKKYSAHPRGCALSWTIRYMAAFAPEEAKKLWELYKEKFFESRLVWGGFREWPQGVNMPADSDSGPIIEGIGVAATALGLGTAKSVGDPLTQLMLSNSMDVGYTYLSFARDPSLKKASESLLADSIRFNYSFGSTDHFRK